MISKRGRLLAAGGVALVATLGLAPADSGAQERVRWKMQSAQDQDFKKIADSYVAFRKVVQDLGRCSGAQADLSVSSKTARDAAGPVALRGSGTEL